MAKICAGTLEGSYIYFHTHTKTAEDMYFYPLCVGYYLCDATYEVNRKRYDSFLIIYVKSGKGYVFDNNSCIPVGEGDVILIDCYKPHGYGATSDWEIEWIHFDGPLARKYYEAASQGSHATRIVNLHNIEEGFSRIISVFHLKKQVNEAVISCDIVRLLTEIIINNRCTSSYLSQKNVVEEAMNYIANNCEKAITLSSLSKMASLSTCYFARMFKKSTGFSPYEYIVNTRIHKAQFLLTTTKQSIKQIAYECGFKSESNFCLVFRKKKGVTPESFRGRERRIKG